MHMKASAIERNRWGTTSDGDFKTLGRAVSSHLGRRACTHEVMGAGDDGMRRWEMMRAQ